MPKRSYLYDLPEDLADELKAKLIANGFQRYAQLTEFINDGLKKRGLKATANTPKIAYTGKTYRGSMRKELDKQQRLAADSQALVETTLNNGGNLLLALARRGQALAHDLLTTIEVSDEPVEVKDVAALLRALKDLATLEKQAHEQQEADTKNKIKTIESDVKSGRRDDYDLSMIRKIGEELYGSYNISSAVDAEFREEQ